MTVVGFLIPIVLFLGLLGLGAFFWSVKSGQYDDLEGAKWRILLDDDDDPSASSGDDNNPDPPAGHSG